MNRQELQEISKLRRKESASLLKAKHYCGAYYLIGYAVECALKSCIAKETKKHDFPDKKIVAKSHTHNLETLLQVSGLELELKNDMKINEILEVNWAVVKDWKETSRYSASISPSDAKDLYSACTSRTHGILSWVKNKW